MKRLVFQVLTILTFLGCRDKVVIDPIDGDGHTHTHAELTTKGFPQMVIPSDNETSTEGIQLGRKLFYDPILSGDETQSCSSCHHQSRGFSDDKRFSVGIDGIAGDINASTIVNAGWQTSAFWDGRAESLEDQAVEPVHNPIEMNLEWSEALERLNGHPTYPAEFLNAFGETNITRSLVVKAIAQFERSLISNNSKFDKFQRGEGTLNALEIEGYNLFLTEDAECFHCHVPPLFMSNRLSNNGLDESPKEGYMGVTGDESDRGKFRIPTLRNIEVSGPYMHDGRFATLEEVMNFYSDSIKTSPTVDGLLPNDHGGFRFTELEKMQLVAFLKTLTDTSFLNNKKFSDPFE